MSSSWRVLSWSWSGLEGDGESEEGGKGGDREGGTPVLVLGRGKDLGPETRDQSAEVTPAPVDRHVL